MGIGEIIAIIGVVIAAASAAYAGVAQSDAADFQSKVAQNNAKASEYQAQDAAARGEIERDNLRRKIAATIGTGRANWGASGVQLGSGSPLNWELETAVAGEQDLAMSRDNTAMEQWGFRNQRNNFLAQSGLYRAESQSSAISGGINSSSSLLSGASQLDRRYGWWSRQPSNSTTLP